MAAQDIEYRSLIFSFIDNFKPQPDGLKGKRNLQEILLWPIIYITTQLRQTVIQ